MSTPQPTPAQSNSKARKSQKWSAEDDRRLLLALLASVPDVPYNYSRIALFCGAGVTKDGADHRFRVLKKEMKKLREEVESGERTEPAPPTPRKRAAPKDEDDASPVKKSRATAASSKKSMEGDLTAPQLSLNLIGGKTTVLGDYDVDTEDHY